MSSFDQTKLRRGVRARVRRKRHPRDRIAGVVAVRAGADAMRAHVHASAIRAVAHASVDRVHRTSQQARTGGKGGRGTGRGTRIDDARVEVGERRVRMQAHGDSGTRLEFDTAGSRTGNVVVVRGRRGVLVVDEVAEAILESGNAKRQVTSHTLLDARIEADGVFRRERGIPDDERTAEVLEETRLPECGAEARAHSGTIRHGRRGGSSIGEEVPKLLIALVATTQCRRQRADRRGEQLCVETFRAT